MVVPILLGVALNEMFANVETFIRQTRDAGRQLEVEGGYSFRQVIERIRIAYAESLNLTMDRVDGTINNTMDRLRNLVEGVQNNNTALLENLATRTQQIANTLPFHMTSSFRSLVRSLAIFRARLQILSLFGFLAILNMPVRMAMNLHCDLMVKPIQASHISTQELEFHVPRASIISNQALSSATAIEYRNGTLETSWPGGGLLGGRQVANFRITIGAIPSSPGVIRLIHTSVE